MIYFLTSIDIISTFYILAAYFDIFTENAANSPFTSCIYIDNFLIAFVCINYDNLFFMDTLVESVMYYLYRFNSRKEK